MFIFLKHCNVNEKKRDPESLKSLFILIVMFENNEQLREARVGGDITITVLQSIFFQIATLHVLLVPDVHIHDFTLICDHISL